MFRFFLPNKILHLPSKLLANLISLLIVVSIIGIIYSIFISPPDYIQGDSVRIMYIHVPSSLFGIFCFALMGVLSILNLIFKIKFLPLISKSIAPVGCIFSSISIVTGSIWGKPTWGTWWAWDARLTSMLILFFFYIAFILIWKLIDDYKKANKISSIIAILGLFNLPIIKYSVVWWTTLHQPSSITLTSAPSIHYTMLVPLIIMAVAMLIYLILIFLMRYKIELIKIKLNKKKYIK
tara:strand:- start:392 stop:1102 length:711 start_codon:yes stop_codon:yes gene_type:complete